MALQLFVTTRQLCQSFAYQTTQLFQQCVVGSIGVKSLNNPLDELCGAFSNGTAFQAVRIQGYFRRRVIQGPRWLHGVREGLRQGSPYDVLAGES